MFLACELLQRLLRSPVIGYVARFPKIQAQWAGLTLDGANIPNASFSLQLPKLKISRAESWIFQIKPNFFPFSFLKQIVLHVLNVDSVSRCVCVCFLISLPSTATAHSAEVSGSCRGQ